jgi:hypothetical protein
MSSRDEILDLVRQHLGHDNLLTVPRSFIDLTGDHCSALLLSQLLYWTDRTSNPDGWVYKSHAEWKEELGLGRYVVDRARRHLAELGLLQQTYQNAAGIRVMHFRLNIPALRSALLSLTPTQDNRRAKRRAPSCRIAGNRQRGVLVSNSPSTQTPAETTVETTPHTTPQTTAEDSAQGIAEGVKAGTKGGKAAGDSRGDQGAPRLQQENEPASTSRGFRELSELYRRQAREQRAKDTSGSAYEDRLFEILERASGFPKDRCYSTLDGLLADFPGLDHILTFGRFAGYWQDRALLYPWQALRRWLERASLEAPAGRSREPARSFIWRTAPNGMCYTESISRVSPELRRSGGALGAGAVRGERSGTAMAAIRRDRPPPISPG